MLFETSFLLEPNPFEQTDDAFVVGEYIASYLVDIKGVGIELRFKNEGVGLAAALKKKYPDKGVVIYSATAEHNLFDSDIDIVDGRLFKASEPIQYSNMIEQYARSKN